MESGERRLIQLAVRRIIIGLSEASQLWDRAMGRAPREAFYSWKGDNYLNPKNEL